MSQKQDLPRAALLARCSSEANVCSQVLTLKQWAAGKYQIDEQDIYGDHIGGSSALSERPQLTRLMERIIQEPKKYALVLAQDPSRIGRTQEQVQEVTDWFLQRNVPLRFLTEPALREPE